MLKWLTDAGRRFRDAVLTSNGHGDDSDPSSSSGPLIIPRDQHNISRKHISDAALKVIARLHRAGFEAYLVGGGVRDLLLGQQPKDFDVATNARPQQVAELFSRSRIIGRRFQIVHVRFGRDVIEVTTFRAGHEGEGSSDSRHARRSDEGMLLRDNVFGNMEEDALRRDFTVNALYYSSADFAIYDYTSGLRDLEQRQLRIIGKPESRYREDPVRMLRAVRFAAKLDFEIEEQTAAPLPELAELLVNVAPARMFDELLKLLLSGYGAKVYPLLQRYGLFEYLFPLTAADIEAGDNYEALILQALRNTDQRIAQERPVTPAFVLAALLWPPLQTQLQALLAQGVPEMPAFHQAATEVITAQLRQLAIPRRFTQTMRDIWELQLRLDNRSERQVINLLENRCFRAAYDFLLLREETGEDCGGLGEWWTQYQQGNEDQRRHLLGAVKPAGRSNSSRRRRPRRKPQA